MQYRFEVYDFAHFSDECHAKMDAMSEAGWRIQAAIPQFAECSVIWERDTPVGAPVFPGRGKDDAPRPDEVTPTLGSAGQDPAGDRDGQAGEPREGDA